MIRIDPAHHQHHAALGLDRSAIRANYQEYINPGLVTLLGLLDADKRFSRASGVSIWDQEGNEYLDFLGAYGAMNTGHNHPAILAALEKVKGMPNMLQSSLNPLAAALAQNLALITPGKQIPPSSLVLGAPARIVCSPIRFSAARLARRLFLQRGALTRNLFRGHQMINLMFPLNAMAGTAALCTTLDLLVREIVRLGRKIAIEMRVDACEEA